jgi:peptide/nickel transport system ATP-binding protein
MIDRAAPPVLELTDVSRNFRFSRSLFERRVLRAVDRVSLTLRKGEVLGIVGESGSGKTTLSKMMLGLLQPSSGAVLIDGKPIADFSRRAIARRIQFVFQDPYSSLNPRHSVGAIIAQPLRIHGVGDSASREKRARELLDVVGLQSRLFDNSPGQLSGGQRQRVVIARALALRPEILICDEPTSALDVSVQSQILNLLLDLRREFDLSYVLVSHNLSVVEHMATQVAVMYLGRIVETAPSDQLFSDARHPYTQALLRAVPRLAPGHVTVRDAVVGDPPSPVNLPPGCRFNPRCPRAEEICRELDPPLEFHGVHAAACHFAWNDPRREP